MSEGKLQWESIHRTDPGRVRSVNEDACLDLPEQGIWVVADGMGGHAAGNLASNMIVDELRTVSTASSLGHLAREVEQRLHQVNQKLIDIALRRGNEIIGSTVVVLLTHNDRCIYLWAGDSRIYLYRRGILKQLSRDHSQLEALVDQGLVSEAQAENHPIANYITRAVGADDLLELDAEIIEPRDGDIFLLCSDGLNKEVSDRNIAALLDGYPLQQAADQLMTLALQQGARDNVSLVLAKAGNKSQAPGDTD